MRALPPPATGPGESSRRVGSPAGRWGLPVDAVCREIVRRRIIRRL